MARSGLISPLTKLDNGSYAYVSTEKNEVTAKGTLTIPAGEMPFTLCSR